MRQQDRLWSVGGPWVVGCEGLGLCIDVLFGSCLCMTAMIDIRNNVSM